MIKTFRRTPGIVLVSKLLAPGRSKLCQITYKIVVRRTVAESINEEWELRYWTKEFGVSEEELREAVRKVGPSVEAVRKELKAVQL